jgi:hypothetical protein
MGERVKNQIRNGILTAVWILVGFTTCTIFVAGLYSVRHPSSGSVLLGATLLLISTMFLIATVSRWAKILPNLLAYAVIVGLIKTVTGDLPGAADDKIPRLFGILLALLFGLSGLIAATISTRRLSTVDRIALIAFAFSLAWAMTERSVNMFAAMGVGIACLLTAWAHNRLVGPQMVINPEPNEGRPWDQ